MMKIKWDPNASMQRKSIAAYIRKRFGKRFEQNFKQEVEDTISLILKYPNIGKIDPLFDDRAETYRSVVINNLSKMVYYIKQDTVRIAAFWDTRQEPQVRVED